MTDKWENTLENRRLHPCPSRSPADLLPCCLPEGHESKHIWKAGAWAAGPENATQDKLMMPPVYWEDG